MSKSTVTARLAAGTVRFGVRARSWCVDDDSVWNKALEPNATLVLHGADADGATAAVVQPAGREPGATPSKFSERSVVATGVPVFTVASKVADPCAVVTCSVNSRGVPATNPAATSSRNTGLFVTVAPGAAGG